MLYWPEPDWTLSELYGHSASPAAPARCRPAAASTAFNESPPLLLQSDQASIERRGRDTQLLGPLPGAESRDER
jgi:hypothetical protein